MKVFGEFYLSNFTPEQGRSTLEKRRVLLFAAVAVVGSFAVQNAQLINDGVTLFDDNKEVPVPPGCDVEDPDFSGEQTVTAGGGGQSVDLITLDPILATVINNRSAAKSMPLDSSASFASRELHVGYFDNHIGDYYQESSGITFSVHSNEPSGFKIDTQDLEAATSQAVVNYEIYQHPGVRQVMQCINRAVFEERRFEGQTRDLFIPSEPNICMNGLLIVSLSPNQDPRDCHTTGFTMPEFRINFGPLSYTQSPYVVVSGGSNNPSIAEKRITRLLVHETIHEYLRLMNTTQRLDPEERFADYVTLAAQENDLYGDLNPISYVPED